MRFINSILVAASALVSLAAAQSTTLYFTKVPTSVVAGTPVTLEWKTADTSTTPIIITLRIGQADDLHDVQVLTSDATGGSYTWTPSKGLGDASNYALQITQGTEVNYSAAIALSGGSASSLAPTASASASSASSASAASSAASSAAASSASASTLSTATITAASSSGSVSSVSKTASSSSGSLTAASTKTTGSSSTTASAISAPTSTGAAAAMGSSPMALIFGAVAAMAYLN